VLPGDGIGEEVIREGLKVLDAVAAIDGFTLERKFYPYGADHYLKTKEAMPASALEEMGRSDAIYMGAIGDPRIETGYLERQIIWGIRQTFDLFVNLRPIRLYHENKKRRLTLVDKANAIRAQDIWTRTFAEVGKEYPEVEQDHAYIDAACMWMVKNPEWFDVVVTPNLFGDILTDIGAMIQGGLGIAASGNIHPGKVSMFEPIHGSAPKYRGQNSANPVAAIEAGRMMLEYLGEAKAGRRIEQAVRHCIETGKIASLKAGAYKCDQVGDMIRDAVVSGA
jgi:isocitrate/isopropylmalate dehydrogenase